MDDLKDIVRGKYRIVPVGNQSKPPLSRSFAQTHRLVSLRELSGVIEYEPSEFTITVWAGTPVREIISILKDQNQYLPFDPMLANSSTIGGTVASGLSGPGRFRYGGIRDFILGCQFLDGQGTVINSGGRVVKNAAGFDVPKLLVSSLGRLAVMTQMTFKVFPCPGPWLTLAARCENHEEALQRVSVAACSRWELDAIDYQASSRTLLLRLAGDPEVTGAIAKDVEKVMRCEFQHWSDEQSIRHWQSVNDLNWESELVGDEIVRWKSPTTPKCFLNWANWADTLEGVSVYGSGALTTTWGIAKSSLIDRVPDILAKTNNGLLLNGPYDGHEGYLSPLVTSNIQKDIKRAFDPEGQLVLCQH